MKRQKVYSLINIIGLGTGICLFILIMLFVHHEFRVDHFNGNLDRIYRIETNTTCVMPSGVGHLLEGQLPEIEKIVRFHLFDRGYLLFRRGERRFTVQNVTMADESVFDIFTFPFVRGDPETALQAPFSLVLTRSLAETIFGDTDPLGETLRVENKWTFTVTGIMEDVNHFHFPIEAIASFSTLGKIWGEKAMTRYEDGWQHPTYLLLSEKHDVPQTAEKINRFFTEKEVFHRPPVFKLRPLRNLYLADISLLGDQYHSHGSLLFLKIFIIVAFFILAIAAANFINLSTARASKRAKEVGVKKVVGASRSLLIQQFMFESILTSFLALVVGFLLAYFLLPLFNRIISGHLSLAVFSRFPYPFYYAGGAILLGILSGFYPALFLSNFESSRILRGLHSPKGQAAGLRKGLTVFQFVLSVSLIISTLIVSRQLNYMKNSDLGFRKDHVLTLDLNKEVKSRKDLLKQELLKSPHITDVTFSCRVPGEPMWTWGDINDKQESISVNAVDPDFFKTYGIEVIEGRNFSWEQATDRNNGIILTEAAQKYFGFDSPVGQRMEGLPNLNGNGQVIGVVKDFHFNSLRTTIKPILFYWLDGPHSKISIRIALDDTNNMAAGLAAVLGHIRHVWSDISRGYPFDYAFLDESFDRQYKSEERLSQVFLSFSVLAIFISCLGLYGLTSFSTEQRTKEIGVRKILGASVSGLVYRLSKEFTRWILLANLIAWPLAYFIMQRWLFSFAYRSRIGLLIFLSAGMMSLFIALFSVCTQIIKASTADPIKALRYE